MLAYCLKTRKAGSTALSQIPFIYAATAPKTLPKNHPTIMAGNCKHIVHHTRFR